MSIATSTDEIKDTFDPTGHTGTAISESSSTPLSARTHRQAATKEVEAEFWYFREGAWHLAPVQPVMESKEHIQLQPQWRQPQTAEFLLPDNGGLLSAENRGSAYNYQSDGTTWDPLLDEARKVLLRAGLQCYDNLAASLTPTSSLAPSSGALSALSNGVLGDITASSTGFVQFAPGSATAFTITFDLGSIQKVRNAVIRFATKVGTCSLPASVTFKVSRDNVTFTSYPAKPVGGTDGDWDESILGQEVELYRCDMDRDARYVQVSILPTGSQTIFIDEIEWYGGNHTTCLGGNVFCGYLGDEIDIAPEGYLKVRATDVLKKLQDNNEVRLTNSYSGNVELADVLYSLLTNTQYWKGSGDDYDAPFTGAEIGWTSGSSVTGFPIPVWQGQANNMLGYCYELINLIGWELYVDGSGVLQLREPPYRNILPDAVMVAASDGNGELRHCRRSRTGKDMRNVVETVTGDPQSNPSSTVRQEPNSVARYGHRRVIITDPLLADQTLREKACDAVLRDYAWRLKTLSAELDHLPETHIKSLLGFRTSRRPFLHSKAKTGSYDQELWSLDGFTEHISRGNWYIEGDFIPYVPAGPPPPTGLTATPNPLNNTQITIAWTAPTLSAGETVSLYNIYDALTEEGFTTTIAQDSPPTVSHTLGGFTPGTRYYFRMSSIANNGIEGLPSSVVSCVAGAGPGDSSNWAITDLNINLNTGNTLGTDGFCHHEFVLTFTSPPVAADANAQAFFGFKHGEFRYAIGAIPSNPLSPQSWIYQDEWHGDRIPSLKTWDGVTDGPLDRYLRFSTDAALPSGTTVYARVFTWQTTNGYGGESHASNIVSYTFP